MSTHNAPQPLSLEQLKATLANKERAAIDLNAWLARHENKEPEYRRVWQDRTELNQEIEGLKREISVREKPFVRTLNESFEL